MGAGKKMKKKTNDFGKGFIYNLILWAKHIPYHEGLPDKWKRMNEIIGKNEGYSCWFNGASDHLYDLEIPKKWQKTKIGKLARQLQDLGLEIGHGNRMMDTSDKVIEDYKKVIELTKELAFEIDKKLGVKPVKASFE